MLTYLVINKITRFKIYIGHKPFCHQSNHTNKSVAKVYFYPNQHVILINPESCKTTFTAIRTFAQGNYFVEFIKMEDNSF